MSFSLDLSKFVNLTEKKAEIVVKKSSIGLFSDIIKDTPVLQGRLRANWQLGINKFIDTNLIDKDKSGRKTISNMKSGINAFKLGDTITLSNNLDYAQRIEFEGYSKKAPAGMVRINVVRWQTHLDEQARKVK